MVQARDIDEVLTKTLQDRRLSGGEKTALTRFLEGLQSDEQKLGYCRHRAFELARAAVADPNSARVVEWLEDVVKLTVPRPRGEAKHLAEAVFGPGDACPSRIIHHLNRTRHKLDVCVFTLTDDRVSDAIIAAHRRKVAVRIVTDNEKAFDLGSDVPRFEAAGVPLKVDNTPYHMHHKFAVFDDEAVLTGSYNWTRSAADFNFENLLVTSEPSLVKAYLAEFERVWSRLK
jgi:mitochondrial cardiolipin hydrolase